MINIPRTTMYYDFEPPVKRAVNVQGSYYDCQISYLIYVIIITGVLIESEVL